MYGLNDFCGFEIPASSIIFSKVDFDSTAFFFNGNMFPLGI